METNKTTQTWIDSDAIIESSESLNSITKELLFNRIEQLELNLTKKGSTEFEQFHEIEKTLIRHEIRMIKQLIINF
jgi:hypothetical protein